jgi:hypothetical protein
MSTTGDASPVPPSADRAPRASVLGAGAAPSDAAPGQEAPFDPLRLCIFTTIAILAWILTPPLVVVWMSTLGLIGYVKAYRAGLTTSRCYLRDVRLVLAYLGTAWLVGAVFTVRAVAGLLG